MTDSELLEAAAKAMGAKEFVITHGGTVFADDAIWDPLTDDGDALRLAVKLFISLAYPGAYVKAYAGDYASGSSEYLGGDSNAATRRAIVRAAATLGQTLPPRQERQ